MTNRGPTPRKSTLLVRKSALQKQKIGAVNDSPSRIKQRKRPRSRKILVQRFLIQIQSHRADRYIIIRASAVLGSIFLLTFVLVDGRAKFLRKSLRSYPLGDSRLEGTIGDMRAFGYSYRPISVVGFFDEEGVVMDVHRLPSRPDHYPSHRQVETLTVMEKDPKASKRYKRRLRDPVDVGSCVAKAEWQKQFYPSCSTVHETDFLSSSRVDPRIRLVNNGYFSDIFRLRGFGGEDFVLKSKRYVHDFTDRNFHRYEKEATSMEKLTASPHIVDIFGFCGETSLIEWSDGGDLGVVAMDERDNLSQIDKLRIGHQVALAVAEMHALPIAHTDITLWQFLKIKGVYKLNDFNRVRWMRRDTENDEDCGFRVAVNGGKWRAPEEYAYEEETEKIDVYSLGNVLFVLLTGLDVFEGTKSDDVHKQVQKGIRPHIPSKVRDNADSVDSSLMIAMTMCHVQDPKKRSNAKTVADFLHGELINYEHMQSKAK